MKLLDWFLLKAALLAFVLLLLQVVFAPKVNLLLTCVLVFASMLSIYETLALAVLASTLTAALLYHGAYPWYYLVLGLIASLINPKQIPDKFIVTILYAILFTAAVELFNPNSTAYFDRLVESLPVTAFAAIPLYFLVLLLFKDYIPKRSYGKS